MVATIIFVIGISSTSSIGRFCIVGKCISVYVANISVVNAAIVIVR